MALSKLQELHQKLADNYMEQLDNGVEDPRLLKEVREFLKDNNITEADLEFSSLKSTDENIITFDTKVNWGQEESANG